MREAWMLTNNRTCVVCGDKIEDASSLLAVCYGCRLDAMVPADYQRHEDYRLSGLVMHPNARCRPGTGKPLLDGRLPPRCCDVAPLAGQAYILHRSKQERQEGLDNVEPPKKIGF
jgi:hypothetical protein